MSEKKRAPGSDLNLVDAHAVGPGEYDEIPELTDEWFASTRGYRGDRLARPVFQPPHG